MSLYAQLQLRASESRRIRVGIAGAGKVGSMYLAQIARTPGVHLFGIAGLSPTRAVEIEALFAAPQLQTA